MPVILLVLFIILCVAVMLIGANMGKPMGHVVLVLGLLTFLLAVAWQLKLFN